MLSEARREEIFDAVGSVVRGVVGRARHPGRMRRVGHDRGAAGGGAPGPRRAWRTSPTPSSSTARSTCCAIPKTPSPGLVRPIVDGDAKCASVAAASVLAKVVRDRLMRQEAEHFPAYGFERNKGYPSPVHQTALRGYGPSAIHRRSWAFVR